jgi:hypothetical protein
MSRRSLWAAAQSLDSKPRVAPLALLSFFLVLALFFALAILSLEALPPPDELGGRPQM